MRQGLDFRKQIFHIVSVFFLISSSISFGQTNYLFNNAKHKLGFVYAYGAQEQLGLHSADYDYEVWFFQLQYYLSLHRRKTWGLDLIVQPQYNRTKFKFFETIGENTNAYELGLNVGFLIRKNFFNDFLSIYGFASTGPHYIPETPIRQARGFAFSDNFIGGLNIKLVKNIYLDLRAGFRHVSNAGMRKPNGGINTNVISIGMLLNIE